MLYIFRGDDIAFSEYDRRICIRLDTFKDLTGWTARFNLVDNEKVFPDISSHLITFGYTSDETAAFPLGRTYGKLTIFDARGQIRQIVQVDVEVCNKIPEPGICGTIAVSIDNVLADYNNMGNKPTINGMKVEGHHDGHYYRLANLDDLNAQAEMVAIHSAQIEGLRQTTQQTAATVSDQGVSIAKNAQDIQILNLDNDKIHADIGHLKEKTKDVDEAICRAIRREETARKEEDRTLSDRIETEVNERSSAVRTLRADLENEKSTRSTETNQLSQNLTAEISNREAECQRLSNEVASESQKRESGDKLNSDRIDAVSDQLDNKIGIVAGNLADARHDFATDLSREAEFRSKADALLESKIEDAVQKAKSALEAEISARKEADDVTIERTRHADAVLAGKIDAEIHAREFTDRALTAEGIKRERKDSELEAAINNEQTERIKGDSDTLAAAKAYADHIGEHALHYCGQVEKVSDLDKIVEKRIGDMYNVKETGANYAWSGTTWDKLSETIDLTPYLKKEDFERYLADLQAADRANEEAIAAEKTAREAADATERSERQAGDSDLKGKIEAEAHTRQTDDEALGTRIDNEITNRGISEEGLKTYIDGKVTELKADDATLDSKISAVSDAVETEKAARIAGDNTEKSAREAAIATEVAARNEAIALESDARAKSDGVLDAKLNSEKEARELAVANEAEAREIADNNERTSRESADAALGTRIDTEIADRTAAVAAEAKSRDDADKAIYTKIEFERQQSIARDNAITGDLAAEKTTRTSEDTRVLEEAKAYADTVGAKAMHFKGVVHDRAALESIADPQNGDMYNVETYTFDDGKTVLGANFAWNGTAGTASKGWDKLSETIDLTPYARKSDVAADKTELLNKIQANAEAIAAVDSKADAISLVANAAKTIADTATENLAAEVERAKSTEGTIADSVVTEKNRADEAERNLDAKIATEKSRAEAAESALVTAVANENSRATAAEGVLTSAIANEKSRALAAESDLTAAINNEETRAKGAEEALGTSIAEEASRAKVKEGELHGEISGETSRAMTRENSLHTEVVNEAEARTSADTALQTNIDSEKSRAIGEESLLKLAVQKVGADLITEASTRESEDARILSESKSYTDEKTLTLGEKLDAEIGNREAAVSAEATMRSEKDAELEGKIGEEKTARETAVSDLITGKTLISNLLFSSEDNPGKKYRLQIVMTDDGKGGSEPAIQLQEVES